MGRKIKSIKFLSFIFLSLALVAVSTPARADSLTAPTLVSFTMSPDTLDLATDKKVVTFDLVVNSPTGIASTQTLVTLTDGISNSLVFPIVRQDRPLNTALQSVEFKGTFTLPNALPSGAYTATAAPILGLNSTGGNGYSSQTMSATSTSTLIGAKNALLVRSSGNLNFAYSTFVGPTFSTSHSNIFTDPKYNSVAAPIWRVGEIFNPIDYYELLIPTLSLKVKSITPATCTSDGVILTLKSAGTCNFVVYTEKTSDYQYKQDDEVVVVAAERTKPSLSVGSIATQSSATLPLTILGPFVFGVNGIVFPVAATPSVCYPVGSYVTIVSGGTCTLNYSTPATTSYLASDVHPLTFQITRAAQTVTFSAPSELALASRTFALSAAASSGAQVIFQSDSPTICSVTENSLKLLSRGNCQVEAIQVGTATLSPASSTQSIAVTGTLPASKTGKAKTIICVKSGKSKTFTGSKCPAGFKAKN